MLLGKQDHDKISDSIVIHAVTGKNGTELKMHGGEESRKGVTVPGKHNIKYS